MSPAPIPDKAAYEAHLTMHAALGDEEKSNR